MANRFLSNIKINDAYTFPASDGTNGQVIKTDGSGNLTFGQLSADSASVMYKDTFTGNGSTTSFTLSNALNDEVQSNIYIDGVYQSKSTYSVSGKAITFSTAPLSGHEIEVISTTGINSGPTAIFTDTFTANGSATAFTLGQTVHSENQTIVFLNGVYQFKGTYTLSGTTLTLDTAPANGVSIEVMSIGSAYSGGDILYDHDFTSAGLMTSNGSGVYSITANNSANWNTAYGWGDHSTQSYATQSYVGTQISNLVDSSPATLNTLNELAAALGDDPNFATTTANSIGTKLPLAGGTLTGGLTGTTATFNGQLTVNPNATSSVRIGTGGTNAGLVFGAVGDELYIGANNTHQIRCKTNNDVEFVANATFASNVTANGIYTAGNSAIIYKAQRNGGAVAGDWSYDDATTDMSLGTSTGHSFSLKTGNTRALTINSSQNATFAGNILPTAENAQNIGSASVRWEDLYVDDGFIRNAYIDEYIYHTGDSDTYIRFTPDTITFREAGADSLVLDSNRNATFAGDVLVEDNLYLTDAGTVRGKIQLNSSDRDDLDIKAVSIGSNMKFFTADTERIRIKSDGNIDIGTISATSSSKVTIQAQGSNGTDETALVLRNYSAAPYTGYVTQEFEVGTVNMAEISGRRLDINNGEIIFRNKKSGTISASMVIGSSGNVGIGATLPTSPAGVARFLEIEGSTAGIVLHDNGNDPYEIWASGGNLVFRYNNTAGENGMLLSGSGNLGIGTTSPAAKLDVEGGARFESNVGIGTPPTSRQLSVFRTTAGSIANFLHYTDASNFQGLYIKVSQATDMVTLQSSGSSGGGFAFTSGNAEKIRFTAEGKVGIGTDSPSKKLVVAQSNVTEPSGIDANTGILIKNNTWSGISLLATSSTGSFITFGDENAGFAGRIQYLHSNDNMVFETAASEKMRILSSGGITFNGDTAAENALDDYEEGTFTPYLMFNSSTTGITYGGADGTVYKGGHYTKVGRVVTFSLRIILTSKGTASGAAIIGGLPYSVAGLPANYGSAMYSFANNFAVPERATITMDSGQSIIRLRYTNSSGAYGNVINSDLNNNSDIILVGTYLAS